MAKITLETTSRLEVFETPWAPGPRDNRGKNLAITYGWHNIADMGDVMIAATPRGICFTGFTVDGKRMRAENRLHDYFPAADISKDTDATAPYATGIGDIYNGNNTCHPDESRGPDLIDIKSGSRLPPGWQTVSSLSISPLPLDLYGTPFQLLVWRALLNIPFGKTASYQDIARTIGHDTAARAVGGAVGDNPISILVPCHRVIQSNGNITNYGWGTPKKRTLLKMEEVAA